MASEIKKGSKVWFRHRTQFNPYPMEVERVMGDEALINGLWWNKSSLMLDAEWKKLYAGKRTETMSEKKIGVPSPSSVEEITCIKLRWEYLTGNEIWERVEIWKDGACLAAKERSIGITGANGPSGGCVPKPSPGAQFTEPLPGPHGPNCKCHPLARKHSTVCETSSVAQPPGS